VSRAAVPEPVEIVDPSGARRTQALTPAGHVALFVRALHAPAAMAVHERSGHAGLVEACAVTRGRDGRPRPHRSGQRAQFLRCGDIVELQALARATRTDGRECWCSVLPRTERLTGGKAVPGGRLLWADVDTSGTLWRARALRERLPVRLVVESGGAADPSEARWHLYLAVSRWLAADELEAANARLAELLGGDRVGDRGRLMRLPGTRNLKSGRPGRWCRVIACDLHAPALDIEAIVGAPPTPATRPTKARPRSSRSGDMTALEAMAPREWFSRLEPDRPISEYGYARCPLHDDHVPSLKLYDEPRDGWYCWACARGGDVIEYAAWRWYGHTARELGAPDFRALMARLHEQLGLRVASRVA
jgi:CHC2 zinc finger